MGDYRERIAAVQHEIWSHWMRYLFSVCGELNDDGSATIPAYNVERWHRQMATGYADLTDKERESDRNQADKVLAERDAEIAQLKADYAAEVDEFNAGFEAHGAGKTLADEPSDTRFDVWRIGWVWGKWGTHEAFESDTEARDAEIERLRAQVAELEAQLSKRAEQQARMWEVFRSMAGAYHEIRTNTDLQFNYYMTQLYNLRD